MHRVAIYAREDPTTGAQARLDAQIAAVAAFVARHRACHVATYADFSPGYTLERPGLVQLVAHARAGWFDLVAVERRDNVAADQVARRQVRDQLAAAGARVVIVRPPFAACLGRVVAGLDLVELVEER
ncbi:MAG: recombinase family protein [Actinomycetota bacterium]|nr:recombinase family protein [Actinomycetota bacterium]